MFAAALHLLADADTGGPRAHAVFERNVLRATLDLRSDREPPSAAGHGGKRHTAGLKAILLLVCQLPLSLLPLRVELELRRTFDCPRIPCQVSASDPSMRPGSTSSRD